MPHRITTEWELEREPALLLGEPEFADYANWTLQIEGSYTRGYHGSFEIPPEGPEIDIVSVKWKGKPFELTDDEMEKLVDWWLENYDGD